MRPSPSRVARPAASTAPWLAITLAALAACQPAPPPSREPLVADERLIVAVLAGPAGWQLGPDGAPQGFEHDLVVKLARELERPIEFVHVRSASELAAKLANGKAHLGMGGLYRPADGHAPRARDGKALPLAWTRGFHDVEPLLVHSRDGYRPKRWQDLAGARVAFLPATGIDAEVARLAREHPEIRFEPVDLPAADTLIARVSTGRIDYALVSSLQAELARNVHLDFEVAFAAGRKLRLAWLVPAADDQLKMHADAFVERARRNGSIARLAHRYFGHGREVPRSDAGLFHARMRSVLPDYRKLFFEAQEATGIEWRLLAAVAYQESQWEPHATSETGVRGFMQLTEDTARHLGVADRLDPRASILGAARYLRDLKGRLPERIAEPDRTWLALAAFNIGAGHLEDARILAQRQKLDPDHWQDVKQALPLLALPEHYEKAKLGYARGGMPVAFVDRVRGYYDILLRHEPSHAPRLRVPGHGT